MNEETKRITARDSEERHLSLSPTRGLFHNAEIAPVKLLPRTNSGYLAQQRCLIHSCRWSLCNGGFFNFPIKKKRKNRKSRKKKKRISKLNEGLETSGSQGSLA